MTEIQKLKNILENESAKVVFFGGAGVSTESGIPDFRSKDGLYSQKYKYPPEYFLSRECLKKEPEEFYKFYKEKMDCRPYEPNIVHKKLAELEKKGTVIGIITQNIDGLHQKAGSECVVEIHGTSKQNYCMRCGKKFDESAIYDSKLIIPKCDEKNCMNHKKGIIRPNIVLYDEQIKKWSEAAKLMNSANVLIIGGTSLQVYPACNLIYEFQGEHIIVINKGDIKLPMLNKDSDFVINDYLGNVFSQL